MNITGSFTSTGDGAALWQPAKYAGAFYASGSDAPISTAAKGNSGKKTFNFNASRNWTGSTSSNGNHSHTVTVNNSGSGNAHNNMPPYLAIYIWKRVA